MKVLLKGLFLNFILVSTVYIDMYQDVNHADKTIVVVEQDGVSTMLSVDTKDLDKESTLKKIEEMVHEQR